MPRTTKTEWQARAGDDVYPVVQWLTDAGGMALHGEHGALLLVDGKLVDSRELAKQRRVPVTIEAA
jgi:hypothetical protein